ncbi:MAG: hypothetical protein ACP5K7_12385 [Verrucomicrobiia bacterium]|jgi:hypothetical protein
MAVYLTLIMKQFLWKTLQGVLSAVLLLNLLLICAIAVQQQPTQEDCVWFTNGDKLCGQIISIDSSKGALLKNKFIEGNTAFPLDKIVKIVFAERQTPSAAMKNPCRVRLINLDEIEGDLISINEKEMVLGTLFSGKISIPRKRIDSVTPIVPNPTIVYQGPTGIEGWTVSDSPAPDAKPTSWKYSNGAFIATESGAIARDLKLPDMATIEFDLAWQNYLSVAIALYASTLNPIPLANKDELPDFGSFYSLQINFNTANLMLIKKGAPLNSMGIAFLPNIDRKTSARLTIRVNKPTRSIYLYIDGVLVRQWVDPGEFGGSGTCVRFVNQLSAPLKISNITVSQWDGRIELPTNQVDNAKSDFVRLLNNDAVTGSVKEFKNDKIIVQTQLGNMEIPISRISQIYFSIIGRDPVLRKIDEVSALLNKNATLTLKIQRWEGDHLVATSPMFGELKIPLWAFKTIVFKQVNQPKDF